jgi:hypothetical protein
MFNQQSIILEKKNTAGSGSTSGFCQRPVPAIIHRTRLPSIVLARLCSRHALVCRLTTWTVDPLSPYRRAPRLCLCLYRGELWREQVQPSRSTGLGLKTLASLGSAAARSTAHTRKCRWRDVVHNCTVSPPKWFARSSELAGENVAGWRTSVQVVTLPEHIGRLLQKVSKLAITCALVK